MDCVHNMKETLQVEAPANGGMTQSVSFFRRENLRVNSDSRNSKPAKALLNEMANDTDLSLNMAGEFALPAVHEVRKDDFMDYVRLLLQYQYLQSLASSGAKLTITFNGGKAKRALDETIQESNLEQVQQKLERKLEIRTRWTENHPEFLVCINVNRKFMKCKLR